MRMHSQRASVALISAIAVARRCSFAFSMTKNASISGVLSASITLVSGSTGIGCLSQSEAAQNAGERAATTENNRGRGPIVTEESDAQAGNKGYERNDDFGIP